MRSPGRMQQHFAPPRAQRESAVCGLSKPFPRGEGAPVRTLGRMRNGDISNSQMLRVKKVKTIGYYHLSPAPSSLSHLAVPHPSRLRRSTFPPGEGFGRCRASTAERYRAITQRPIDYRRTGHALTAAARRKIPICCFCKIRNAPMQSGIAYFLFVISTKYLAILLLKCYNAKLRVYFKLLQKRRFLYGFSGQNSEYCHHCPR